MGLGEVGETFRCLEKGLEARYSCSVFLKVDPVYDGIRCDGRFQKLLASAGFSG
jgi:hypothetical protein